MNNFWRKNSMIAVNEATPTTLRDVMNVLTQTLRTL